MRLQGDSPQLGTLALYLCVSCVMCQIALFSYKHSHASQGEDHSLLIPRVVGILIFKIECVVKHAR
jgi:hypothetical protein